MFLCPQAKELKKRAFTRLGYHPFSVPNHNVRISQCSIPSSPISDTPAVLLACPGVLLPVCIYGSCLGESERYICSISYSNGDYPHPPLPLCLLSTQHQPIATSLASAPHATRCNPTSFTLNWLVTQDQHWFGVRLPQCPVRISCHVQSTHH